MGKWDGDHSSEINLIMLLIYLQLTTAYKMKVKPCDMIYTKPLMTLFCLNFQASYSFSILPCTSLSFTQTYDTLSFCTSHSSIMTRLTSSYPLQLLNSISFTLSIMKSLPQPLRTLAQPFIIIASIKLRSSPYITISLGTPKQFQKDILKIKTGLANRHAIIRPNNQYSTVDYVTKL